LNPRARKPQAVRRRTSSAIPDWVIKALAAAFLVAAVGSGILVFTTVRGLASAWTGTGINPFQSSGNASPGVAEGTQALPTPVADVGVTAPEWNGSDRVTVLLMGLDYRDWLADEGAPRTDSMMLLTLDPVARTAGMLSIPRDLWVGIPGFEHNRINTAYSQGEGFNVPGGGPGLAMKTVENLLGVPVQYYAVIDFHTFERMVDEIGGIDILVTEDVKISPIGRQSRWLYAGHSRHLDGAETLAYARARKTGGGDFDRANRQQQVALALRDTILDLDMVPTLLTKAPTLYQELSEGIRTNLTLDQMISLGMMALQVPKANIQKGVISPPDHVTLEALPDGAQVLKPVPDRIRELRDQIFTNTSVVGPSVPEGEVGEGARIEAARISVLNGSGTEGLATQTAEYFKAQGLNVAEVGNADRLDYDKSLLMVQNATYPYAVRFLASVLNLSQSQILYPTTSNAEVDVIVILGYDWAAYVAQQGGLQ
jgi:polyisoprenyl-teichoic acid--peptidoglycan teichoic acid transferase